MNYEKEYYECFQFYEKAIEGRNFHYQNYNSWVNLYSIFTGAIFIAFYTVIDKNNFLGNLIKMILPVIGFIASSCWQKSVQGFYDWMNSWIKVVQEYEDKLNKISYPKVYHVYGAYLNRRKGLSTQKITMIFIKCLMIAWIGVYFFSAVSVFSSYFDITSDLKKIIKLATFAIVFLVGICCCIVVYNKISKAFSYVKEMHDTID